MDGFLDPSKLTTYRRNKMTTNGINGGGFESAKPAGTSPWPTENYSPATGSFPTASDKSSQDGSGLGANGK